MAAQCWRQHLKLLAAELEVWLDPDYLRDAEAGAQQQGNRRWGIPADSFTLSVTAISKVKLSFCLVPWIELPVRKEQAQSFVPLSSRLGIFFSVNRSTVLMLRD